MKVAPNNKSLLLVVDAQNGFMTTDSAKAIIPVINQLITQWQERDWPIVFSKFINQAESPWVRLMDWSGCMDEPDTALCQDLKSDGATIYEKTAYSAWSAEISQLCLSQGVMSVMICGVDTDQCVLATAIAVFEAGLRPVIITNGCTSSAGDEFHQAGLKLLKRLIGEDQLISSQEVT